MEKPLRTIEPAQSEEKCPATDHREGFVAMITNDDIRAFFSSVIGEGFIDFSC